MHLARVGGFEHLEYIDSKCVWIDPDFMRAEMMPEQPAASR